jgi:hypothetical protein
MGGIDNMADDRMKNDDLQRNMGGTRGEEGQNVGQQSPGRSGQSNQQGGQQAGSHGGAHQARDMEEDDDLGAGGAGKTGTQNRGGQNR